jgi:hypothetical protein
VRNSRHFPAYGSAPSGEYGLNSSVSLDLRGMPIVRPSIAAERGLRAQMPRLANFAWCSVTRLKPVPVPVAIPAGQSARRLEFEVHSIFLTKSLKNSPTSPSRSRLSCSLGCTSMPSDGCPPQSWPFSS